MLGGSLLTGALIPSGSEYALNNPVGMGLTGGSALHPGYGPISVSSDGTTVTTGGSGNTGSGAYLATDIVFGTGKYYWESVFHTIDTTTSSAWFHYHEVHVFLEGQQTFPTTGVVRVAPRKAYSGVGISGASGGFYSIRNNATEVHTNPFALAQGDRFSYRLDTDTRLLEVFRNGSSFTGSSKTLSSAGHHVQFIIQGRPGQVGKVYLNEEDWVYAPETL